VGARKKIEMMDRREPDIARAAWLYYVEERTQDQIASELGVSRSTVVRLLQKAKDSGMVRITVDAPDEMYRVERRIEEAFGLDRVRLVPATADDAQRRRWLGLAGADVLTSIIEPGMNIAVGWGRTLQGLADALKGEHAVEGVTLVPLVGGLHRAPNSANASNLAEQLGRYFRAKSRALYAPIFVADPAAAGALCREPEISETLGLAQRSSIAIFSAGTLSEDATLTRLRYLAPTERQQLLDQGVVGEVICRWINEGGAPVDGVATLNPIGLRLEELQAIEHRLVVAGGLEKRDVIRALLRGGYATTLVTDDEVAAYLLDGVASSLARRSS
jgi:deoxyribonucleoside regulator